MAEKIFNDLTKGMVRKVNPLKKDQNLYNFALNMSTDKARADRLTKVCENKLEDYFSLKNVDYVILNSLYLGVDEYVFFITDKISSFSEIIYYNKGQITTKYNNSLLNFNASNVIQSTYRINYNGDRLVYFVDGLNKDRVINIDKVGINDDIESISVNPIYDYSDKLDYEVVEGGILRVGEYFVLVSYNDINNKETIYKDIIDGIPIEIGNYNSNNRKVITNAVSSSPEFLYETREFRDIKGGEDGDVSSKSIRINITKENFKSINVYVIRKTGNDIEVYLRENITASNSYTIYDLNDFQLLGSDISEVVVNNIIYSRSEAITQKDNRLILGNTNIESYNYDFQSFANTIKVGYDIELEAFSYNINMYSNAVGPSQVITPSNIDILNNNEAEVDMFSTGYYLGNTENKDIAGKTFMRDEVYALGVYFELENGVFTDVYHIPGRKDNDSELFSDHNGKIDENGTVLTTGLYNTWDTRNISIDGKTDQAWRVINTAVEGMLGYYRCEEVYPEGYGFPDDGEKDVNGNSYVRHHRIPSDIIEPLFDKVTFPDTSVDGYLNRRNIKLTFDYDLPSNLQGIVKNIFFTYAKRDEINKKVTSKGIVYKTRFINNTIRNSENLNSPTSQEHENASGSFYEFKSPDVDFKFKEFNIKSDHLKINSLLHSYTTSISKAKFNFGDREYRNDIDRYPGSFLNAEGINPSTDDNATPINTIYDFKQEFGANRIKYSLVYSYDRLRQYNINDIIFIDNNAKTSFVGESVRFEGNQNSSIFKLTNPTISNNNTIFNGDFASNYLLGLTGLGQLSNNYVSFYNEKDGNPDQTYSQSERNIILGGFYDSTLYISLLNSNRNIYSDVLNIEYVLGTNKDYIHGDCFIDYHYTKKSYSTAVESGDYSSINSRKVKDSVWVTGSENFDPTYNIDMSVYDSYIAFPVETRINIRLRKRTGENNYHPHFSLDNNASTEFYEKKALQQEEYLLNQSYKQETSLYTLYANTLSLQDLNNQNKKVGNRLVYSELQNNESKIDSFRKFLANNYKDIITTKGDIHKLFIKNNNLNILTRDSLFVIGSDNNYLNARNGTEIYVGTGEFLGTEPEELISLETGYAGTVSKLSFNENKFGYLFVDSIRNKIILYNDSLIDVNILGLEEDLSINLIKQFPELTNELDKPLLGYGILSGFDPETDRIFVTKLDYKATDLLLNSDYNINNGLFYINNELVKFNNSDYFENKSLTVTYDAINNNWISYHNYFPTAYINNPSKLLIKTEDEYVKQYGGDYTDLFIIDFLFNENQGLTKVFDSIQMDINSESSNGEFTENFFNQMIVYTQSQSSGLISLNSEYPSNNITKKDTYWNFSKLLDISDDKLNKKLFLSDWNSIKDNYFIDKVVNTNDLNINKDWYRKKRFRDKYVNIRLIKNNVENNKFTINFGILNYRRSVR